VSAPLSIERETSPPGRLPGDLPETRQVISKTHALLKDYHKIQDGTPCFSTRSIIKKINT
jgi:hypothetical protein